MSKEAWFNGVRKLWRHIATTSQGVHSLNPTKIPTFGKYYPRGDNPEDWVNIHDVMKNPREFPGLFSKIMAEDPRSCVMLRTGSLVPVDGIEVVAKCLLLDEPLVKVRYVTNALVQAYTGGSDERAYWPRFPNIKGERNILNRYTHWAEEPLEK